ncbi:MAG: class II glutamine amidotransferase [Nitrososphaerales archaeon]|jgi:predicted glutamine amidotransferase
MCRIAGYVGDSRENLEKLVDGLRWAARNDTTSGTPVVHGDGWGYAIYSDLGRFSYRTPKAIFEDEIDLHKTKGRICAILHARKASPGYKADEKSSHPFFGETEDSFVYFAHNGSLDDEVLRGLTGFNGDAIDSELAFRYMLQRGIFPAASELENYVKPNSALNLLVLEIRKGGGAEVYVKSYYNKDGTNRDMTEYYQMLKQDMDGGKAAFSSTFNDNHFMGKDLGKRGLIPFSEL